MAFYEDRVEHFGGALVLFKRNLAVAVPNAKSHRKPAWYMRLKIGGRTGYVTKSTKLKVYEDAYEYAKSELLRLQRAKRRALNQIFLMRRRGADCGQSSVALLNDLQCVPSVG